MILDEIVAHKRIEVAEAKRRLPLEALFDLVATAPPRRDYFGALRGGEMRLIAEIKRASPSKGVLRADFDLLGLASCYVAGGASAISVLTDQKYFGGTLE